MNITGKKIDSFLSNTGKSASQMSRGLKKLGDGSMEKGINKVAEYMFKDGSDSGFRKGFGVATVVIGSGILIYKSCGIIKKRINEKKQLKCEEKDIIEAFEDIDDENEKTEEVESIEDTDENEKVEEVESIEDDDENEKVEEIESVEEAEEAEKTEE